MGASVADLLKTLVKQRGSDLHVSTGSVPMMRLHGELVKADMPVLTAQDMEIALNSIMSKSQKQDLLKNKSVDFSVPFKGVGVFRVNVFFQRKGLTAVFRALSEKAPSLESLSLPPICKVACSYANGLVLVTGPTGSGKSTTLAAMIDYINTNQRRHILTLEDPVEFYHDTKRSMVNQRQLGQHFVSFASALKAALREDPDVILVGEMRDPETIALAITAAETGHLVFATLHTNSASKSVDRILDSFPGEQQGQIRSMMSESLRVILSQKLIPTADQKNRICVHDILVNNSAISNLIREGKTYQLPSVMQTSRKDGMQLMDQSILEAVNAGVITGEVGWEYANDKSKLIKYAPKEQVTATQLSRVGATQAGKKSA
ncbi:type IV pilus twitching motility protein PilT [bacterium]|nr:type IV pilus twitching motility protein PilT [bacterium]